jgi:hypothetical protein
MGSPPSPATESPQQGRTVFLDPVLYPVAVVREIRLSFAGRCEFTDLADFTLSIAPAPSSDQRAVDEFLNCALHAALDVHLAKREP